MYQVKSFGYHKVGNIDRWTSLIQCVLYLLIAMQELEHGWLKIGVLQLIKICILRQSLIYFLSCSKIDVSLTMGRLEWFEFLAIVIGALSRKLIHSITITNIIVSAGTSRVYVYVCVCLLLIIYFFIFPSEQSSGM